MGKRNSKIENEAPALEMFQFSMGETSRCSNAIITGSVSREKYIEYCAAFAQGMSATRICRFKAAQTDAHLMNIIPCTRLARSSNLKIQARYFLPRAARGFARFRNVTKREKYEHQ